MAFSELVFNTTSLLLSLSQHDARPALAGTPERWTKYVMLICTSHRPLVMETATPML